MLACLVATQAYIKSSQRYIWPKLFVFFVSLFLSWIYMKHCSLDNAELWHTYLSNYWQHVNVCPIITKKKQLKILKKYKVQTPKSSKTEWNKLSFAVFFWVVYKTYAASIFGDQPFSFIRVRLRFLVPTDFSASE